MQKIYRTTPLDSTHMPPGIPYIIGNEAAERFSFYGMKAILFVFMTEHLLDRSGHLATMNAEQAKVAQHTFNAAVYLLPVLGAIMADVFIGKYRTILGFSIVYCLGHLALALDETRLGLFVGLSLIALGAGGIKPCVSANVGDQFGRSNQHLLEKVFSWFYFSINLGALASMLITPYLLEKHGPHVAFGVPGILMLIATIVFWMGRNKFVHVPPGGWSTLKQLGSKEAIGIMLRLGSIYVLVAFFWALYDQSGTSWVDQAKRMDQTFQVTLPLVGTREWTILPSQVQSVNGALILVFIPLFAYGVYPLAGRLVRLTALRKISAGLFVMALAFAISSWLEERVAAGERPSILWQFAPYVILTAAEVLVSITVLEFSYTQAPPNMKSLVMALSFFSVAFGNLITAGVNALIEFKWLDLHGPAYYWFFTGMMLAAAIVFIFVALRFHPQTHLADEGIAGSAAP